MKQIRPGKLHDPIREDSLFVKDPAGRNVRVIYEEKAETISEKYGVSLHDVFAESLRIGIFPYRYIRNSDSLGFQDQLKLAESHVAVVGAGGLGGQAILLLSRMGIGRLSVIDSDKFDETNLNRQALSSKTSLGVFKSQEAYDLVRSINPAVEFFAHRLRLDASNCGSVLERADVVLDCLDNIRDRFVIEECAKALGRPLVHGAVAGFEGRVMTIFPADSGLSSLYGERAQESENHESAEKSMGVTAPAVSFIATLQVMEAIKIILGRGRIMRNRMLNCDLETGEITEFSL